MKASIIAVLLLASASPLLNVEASLAQELSAEDRACINAAIDRLPHVDALRVEGSRILMSQTDQAQNKQHPYFATVEIDVRVAGAKTTHSFFLPRRYHIDESATLRHALRQWRKPVLG